MNDTARTMLARLIALNGVSIAHDTNRCEGLLRDTCPECTREIFVLVHAVRQHVTDNLLTPRHTLPLALTEAFLVKRLEDELGFFPAKWHGGRSPAGQKPSVVPTRPRHRQSRRCMINRSPQRREQTRSFAMTSSR